MPNWEEEKLFWTKSFSGKNCWNYLMNSLLLKVWCHIIFTFIHLQIQQFIIMKKPFYEVEKMCTFLEKGRKLNLNNYLRGSYLIVILWIIASLCIFGKEFKDFLNHKVDGPQMSQFSRNWHCYGWPKVGDRKYPCQVGWPMSLGFTTHTA